MIKRYSTIRYNAILDEMKSYSTKNNTNTTTDVYRSSAGRDRSTQDGGGYGAEREHC